MRTLPTRSAPACHNFRLAMTLAALYCFAALGALGLLRSPAARAEAAVANAAQDQQQELVILIDCSSAMTATVPGDTRTYYQAAVQAAGDEMKFTLESGIPVRIIPFRERALERPDVFTFTPGKVALSEQLSEAATCFDAHAPKPGQRTGAAIWDTLVDVMPKIVAPGRRTTVSIYTANQDNRSSITQAQAEAKLQERYKQAKPAIMVMNPATGLPPRAGVKVTGTLPILDAAACNSAKGATVGVQVSALLSSAAGPANILTLDQVRAVPLAGAPAITVTPPSPADALTTTKTSANVALTVTGKFPPEPKRYEYDLLFFCRFRARPNDKANPDEIVAAGRALRLVIASTVKPEAQFTVTTTDLKLRPGEYKDVPVTINYNAAASDKVCQLRALAPPSVSSEWYPPGQPAPGPGDKGEAEINVSLPTVSAGGTGGNCTLLMRLRASKPTSGQVRVTGRLGDASPAAPPINVDVVARVLRVTLRGKGEQPTVLAETQGREQWQDLAHPLTLHPDAPLKGATATLTVVGANADVAVAFDRAGATTRTVNLDSEATVELFAHLNTAAPASPPSMPAVQVVVSDKSVVTDPPDGLVALDGAAGLSAPDFWVVSVEGDTATAGAAAPATTSPTGSPTTTAPTAPQAARTLTLASRKVRTNQRDVREVLLNWNAAATGTVIDVAPESTDGGKVVAVEPVNPESGPPALTALGPWRIQINKLTGGAEGEPSGEAATSGRLRLTFQSSDAVPTTPAADPPGVRLSAAAGRAVASTGGPSAPPPAPWIVLAPYNVAPTVFTVVVDKGGQSVIPLYVGASQPVANLRAWSDGLAGKLLVKFQPHTPGDAVAVALGDQAAPDVVVAPQGQQAASERGVSVSARFRDFSKAGRRIAGDLVLQAVTEDPNTVIDVRDSSGGAPANTDRVPLEFEIKACSLHALWNGKDTKVIPGERFMVSGSNATLHTAAARQPMQLKLLGAEALPEEIASKKIRAVATNPDGLIQSVKFDMNGKPPQDEVTLADVAADQVRGLVITASPDKSEKVMRQGQVTLEVPDLAMSLPLDVNMRLPDQTRYGLWIGVAAGVVVLLLVLVSVLKRSPAPVPVAATTSWEDESLLGGPAQAQPVRSAPAAAPPTEGSAAGIAGAAEPEMPPAPSDPWEQPEGQGESLLS